jgi:Zn-dependent M28 family amino/carboxypeptidase
MSRLLAVACLALACAAPVIAAPVAADTAPPAAVVDTAWVLPDLQRLVRPSNAERFEALKALLDEKGLKYEVHAFDGGEPGKPMQGRNLIVTLGGGSSDIVVGAHYDAVTLDGGKLVDGVLDNGASVVALVHAAKQLSQQKGLTRRVRIAFWDQEELGLIGSKAWLAQTDRTRIAASVNFDVNGYGDTLIYGGMREGQTPAVHAALLSVCARRQWDCIRFPNYAPSDDISFAKAGIPVVSIAFQPKVDAHQMWLALNGGSSSGLAPGFTPPVFTRIHSAEDVMARVEPHTVAAASQAAVDMVLALDKALPAN